MKKNTLLKFFFFPFLICIGCSVNDDYIEKIENPELFQMSMQNLTDIVVYDIFSPPVASRVYVYPSIAAYEIIRFSDPLEYLSLSGQLKDLNQIKKPYNENINLNLAAIYSFNIVGRTLIFSEDKYDEFEAYFEEKLDNFNVPSKVRKASRQYAKTVANHIIEWAKNDNYDQTRTFPKYTILEPEKYWKPTPPDYMDGIEPHWNKIRTLVLESADMFPAKPPLEFNLKEGSPFQMQLKEVYQYGNSLTDEQLEMAKFWDCNPYVTHHRGHAMFATKKITPGGHWIGITGVATRQTKSDFAMTINAYANVSIALFDAFISCWDEKWKTIVVRPETIINKYYDEEWLPKLQTPPFPEYTSGHSVISRAAAITLTSIYGEKFAFIDTTERKYGLSDRKFDSFIGASEEAAISRLYGGIHYMMAIEEGVLQGDKIGKYIVNKISTKSNKSELAISSNK
ncbi:MAG: phosphatidic acid phosphatase [Flavobacteriaceae bacterium]|nr:phosphatidic acid phosphatase [Flavobacteriaceae bacterium]